MMYHDTDSKPVRQIGIEIAELLWIKYGDIGDSFELLGLAYLEGLDRALELKKLKTEGGGK